MAGVMEMVTTRGVGFMGMDKLTQTKLEALEEQIRLYKEQNKILQQNMEDSRITREYLYQQLNLYREREKLSLMREQRDYQKIMELDKKVKLLSTNVHELPVSNGLEHLPKTVNGVFNMDDHFIVPDDADDEEHVEVEYDEADKELQNVIDQFLSPDAKISPQEVKPLQESYEVKTVLQQEEVSSETSSVKTDESVVTSSEPDDVSAQEVPAAESEEPQKPDSEVIDASDEKKISESDTINTGVENEAGENDQTEDQEIPDEAEPKETSAHEDSDYDAESEQNVAPSQPQDSPPAASDTKKSSETKQQISEPVLDEETHKLVTQYFNQGLQSSEAKNYSDAIENFIRVTQLLPSAPPSYLNLAIIYFRQGEFEKAKEYAQTAIDLGSEPAKRVMTRIELELP